MPSFCRSRVGCQREKLYSSAIRLDPVAYEEVIVGLLVVAVALLLFIAYRSLTVQRPQEAVVDLVEAMRSLATDVGEVRTLATDLKSFSSDFRALLIAPKLRGGLGEVLLGDLCKDALPPSAYQLQYTFSDGSVVDAVVRSDRGLIPVDSKFPLAGLKEGILAEDPMLRKQGLGKLRRAALKHIRDIFGKYIQPADGTVTFAVMYLPGQAIYEHLIADEEVVEEARRRNVLLSSPNTFYFLLRVILLGLHGKRLEQVAARILGSARQLGIQADTLADDLSVLQTHLHRAKNKLDNTALPHFQGLQRRIGELTAVDLAEELEELGSPELSSEDRAIEDVIESEIDEEKAHKFRSHPGDSLAEAISSLRLTTRREKQEGGERDEND